jgi:UDP-N-acetylmuramyl pentapeptide phosphotransferase/UDP-N-acetylglucosamine-1-phosphate transferase
MNATLLGTTALASAGATLVLGELARRIGWGDRASAADHARKLQERPVPPVGGAALLAALGVHASCAELELPWGALLLAFAVGTIDDLLPRGLAPLPKLLLQLVVALFLAQDRAPLQAAGLALAAVAAMNCANTFDHADGLLAGLGVLALGGLAPLGAAALGFLPFNLSAGRPWRPSARGATPYAFLGDAGSHVLGLLFVAIPVLRPLLLLPALDLAWVCGERLRARQAPWIGDRRHLGQRLERCGAPRALAALVACGIALPFALAPTLAGGLASGALFLLTRAWTSLLAERTTQ